MRVLRKYWFVGVLILAFWVILVLLPVTFNGCGEKEPPPLLLPKSPLPQMMIQVDIGQTPETLWVWASKTEHFTFPNVPTYQDGLDTVGCEKVPIGPCDCVWFSYDGTKYHNGMCASEDSVHQFITKPIMKPLIKRLFTPEELKALNRLIERELAPDTLTYLYFNDTVWDDSLDITDTSIVPPAFMDSIIWVPANGTQPTPNKEK